MLVPNQIIEVSWHSQSKEHYIKKGYRFTNYKDKFYVKAEDLSKSATQKVSVLCDFCGRLYSVSWYHYIDNIKKNTKCACYNCRHKKDILMICLKDKLLYLIKQKKLVG